MARLADTLTEAGHNVTFLAPVMDERRKSQLGVKITKDVVLVEQDEEMKHHLSPVDDDMALYWKTEVTPWNMNTIFSVFTDSMRQGCANFLRNKDVYDSMKSRNFDVGIYEPLSVCGLGFMYAIGIRRTISASSCVFYDSVLNVVGEPLELSHVPAQTSKFGEDMSLSERVHNYQMSKALEGVNFKGFEVETKLYQEHFDVPDWRELMLDSSFHFVNAIPYLDFPRTVTQKTISIGGISIDMEFIESQKLSKEWSDVLDTRKHNMLISFGSLVRSQDMPIEWRRGLLEAIRSEPNVTFIWKYESDDVSWAKGVSNIHFSKWVPQTALLNHPRLSAFLTHGGLGNQERNANMLARHGGVRVFQKNNLENVKTAIHDVLFNKDYLKHAKKLAELLNNQPTHPKNQVVNHLEFAGKFGPFPEMNSRGIDLGFIQKNLIDVYFVFTMELTYACCYVAEKPDIFTKDSAFLIITNTKESIFPVTISIWMDVVFIGFYGLSIALLAIHFIYRYLAISKSRLLESFQNWKLILWLLFPTLNAAIWIYVSYVILAATEDSDRFLEKYYLPTKKNGTKMEDLYHGGPFYYMTDKNGTEYINWKGFQGTWIVLTLIILSFTTMIYFGLKCYKTMGKLMKMTSVSEKYKSLQSQLFYALVFQTIIPVFLMHIPATMVYVTIFFNCSSEIFGQVLNMSIAMYPALNPLPTIFIVKHYRRAVMDHMCCRKAGRTDSKVYNVTRSGNNQSQSSP
ncbi:hypothetical protein L5515_006631 [Caenorhabditis briggsae]|uniref:Serpentine receptor class r-10 n=1 Tax=Caenorhabditis briggsae TaxID=6238 RepID=A0AAE9F4W4_CAEBR|nr:hypothetical protein L5515_006631 [Caenorhabditis briggsae]